MFTKILNANDGSDNAFKALDVACGLAAKLDAEVHMIAVEELQALPDTDMIDEIAEQKAGADHAVRGEIRRARAIAARHGVALESHVFTGHVVRTVVDFASDNGFDLLVIGATGRAALYERMLGTRADRISHLARCPVLIVR
ncbi:MAG TPA: universal stress protein [Caulobacteraceae bacterium]|nr:universal stress protein [Caulobacteraceae bacterium]